MASRQPETFNLPVPDAALTDFRERFSRTRFPDQPPGNPWAYGTVIVQQPVLPRSGPQRAKLSLPHNHRWRVLHEDAEGGARPIAAGQSADVIARARTVLPRESHKMCD
jgi:hypothetical protein